MVATLEITPDQCQDIEISQIPGLSEKWLLDGMIYHVHNIIWQYTINDKDVKVYKPVIIIHS